MRDILLLLLAGIAGVFVVGLLVILNKLVELGYYYVDALKSKQTEKVRSVNENKYFIDKTKQKTEQMPIDMPLPQLKDPPRSPGGFGSRVQ